MTASICIATSGLQMPGEKMHRRLGAGGICVTIGLELLAKLRHRAPEQGYQWLSAAYASHKLGRPDLL